MTTTTFRAAGFGGVITAQVNVDLTEATDDGARYLLGHLDAVPDGATLMVHVGNLRPGFQAINYLRDHIHRLHVVFAGTDRPEHLHEWVHYLRYGIEVLS